MTKRKRLRPAPLWLALFLLLFACSSEPARSPAAVDGDLEHEADAMDGDADGQPDGDTHGDGDAETEPPADALPSALPFSYSRDDGSQPPSAEETETFTAEMLAFYTESRYFDWLLRMSHGMDASSGMRDYRLWWTDTHALKQGDAVTMVHDWSEQHGGHNILKGNSTVTVSAIGAYLNSGDEAARELAEQYCKGFSQTMLGMVHDDNDPLPHLMARNVVTANHSYTTHDGYEKHVDYSNWFFAYDRWNCSRFKYEHNPYWGEVWVTNTRSKDGLGYLFNATASILYAAKRAPDAGVRAACEEAYTLLKAFTKDIVDSGYQIRTKDSDGAAYILDKDTMYDPDKGGDLASFVYWDALFPAAECNNTLVAELLAYESPREVRCSDFGGNLDYEWFSIQNNAPNGHIMRAFHIAAIKWALLRGYDDVARASLDGLEQRFLRDADLDMSKVNSSVGRWERDLYVNKLQAATAGYPLSGEDVRRIRAYFSRAAAAYAEYDNWNLWDARVGDGEHEWLPPSYGEDEGGERIEWIGAEAMGLLFEYCASPFKNAGGVAPVDCAALVEGLKAARNE